MWIQVMIENQCEPGIKFKSEMTINQNDNALWVFCHCDCLGFMDESCISEGVEKKTIFGKGEGQDKAHFHK